MPTFEPIPTEFWTYRAAPRTTVDGDTIDVFMDLGRRTYAVERLRMLYINAPELHGVTAPMGLEAKAFTDNWLKEAAASGARWPLVIKTEVDDAFGRYLAFIWRVTDGACLNADLLTSGHAIEFMIPKH